MATSSRTRRISGAGRLQGGDLRDFSGGPNLRDAPPELGLNEDSDAWNVTFDERGGVGSRLGYVKYNSSLFGTGVILNVFWSSILGTLFTQAGANVYKGTSTTAVKTFTSVKRAAFAEIAGNVIIGHPDDGLWTSTDGNTWTKQTDPNAPLKVDALAVWQNKLWTNDRSGTNPSRVWWSNAGPGNVWTATNFVDLREKDDAQVVALHISSGQDVLGRPGLVCFKNESFYRIHDSATGAYETVDNMWGAASNIAVTGVGARIYAICKHGIGWWAEGRVGMVNASDQYQPLWDPAQVNLSRLDLWCAGRRGTRARFSLPRAGSTANDLAIEVHPEQSWVAPGSNAMSCYASASGTKAYYGGSPANVGQVYQLDLGGTDDGLAITSRFQSRWVELANGFEASVWQVRMHGRGQGTITFVKDYQQAGGDTQNFLLADTSLAYDSGYHYDAALKYPIPAFQYTQPFYSIGPCRQLSFLINATTTTTAQGKQLLGAGTSPLVGAWALYGLEWLYAPLGLF